MTIIGTIYDIFIYQKHIENNEMNKINDNVGDMSMKIKIKANSFLYLDTSSNIGKVLICFSAYTNTKKMFSMNLDPGIISVIHGLKFLSMCLLIIIHSVYFKMDCLDNKVWLWRWILENYGTFVYHSINTSVDTFFFSSGCLVTYLYWRNRTNEIVKKPTSFKDKLTELFIYVIKRFVR
ncbi:PREDICTED: nose resistant to fluoxetine protein 6-like, partial [Wasmannia auropunctata]|uniref:nose resistant to fluoxetine protein 6-like n=1 Tax=Wasmannia auropunctata TaxID=64793 RepID=UPI0005EF5287